MLKQMFLVLDTEHNRRSNYQFSIGELIHPEKAKGDIATIDTKTVNVVNQDKMSRKRDWQFKSINPVTEDNYRWFEESAVNDFRPRLAGDIVKLRHNGWYVDDEFQDETTFGIVLRLPHGRGFLAGCSDPYNWPKRGFGACLVENYVYADEDTAARCADQIAEKYAEDSREANAKQHEQQAIDDAESERQEMVDNLP